MNCDIMYIELKTGYHDDGPAWIGRVKFSKSKQTIYFDDKAFKKGSYDYGNYTDIETGDSYWISGVKKNGQDRHWAGSGKIMIDKNVVKDYLTLTGQASLDSRLFIQTEIKNCYPIERINQRVNGKVGID